MVVTNDADDHPQPNPTPTLLKETPMLNLLTKSGAGRPTARPRPAVHKQIKQRTPLPMSILGVGALLAALATSVLMTEPANAATTVTLEDRVLSITGDAASNSLSVGRRPDGIITLNGAIVLNGQATVGNVDIIGMDGGEGNDTLRIDETNGSMPAAKLVGGIGNDRITGGSGDDIIDGGEGADSIDGGAGADRIDCGAGNDKVIGGPGDDIVDLGADSDVFTVKTGEGNDRKVDGADGTDTLRVTGSDGVDLVSAFTNFNDESEGFIHLSKIPGTSEFMSFVGFEHLQIDAGSGADLVAVEDLATAGIQVVRVNVDPPTGTDGQRDSVDLGGKLFRPNRILIAGTPSTRVTAALGSTSVIIIGAEALNVSGGLGPDIVDASRLTAGTLDLTENLDGGIAGDILIGSPGNDVLIGGDGDDRIECRGGVDVVKAGLGNNTVIC
jgi:Ca2+-binding RTX toxin-like protein